MASVKFLRSSSTVSTSGELWNELFGGLIEVIYDARVLYDWSHSLVTVLLIWIRSMSHHGWILYASTLEHIELTLLLYRVIFLVIWRKASYSEWTFSLYHHCLGFHALDYWVIWSGRFELNDHRISASTCKIYNTDCGSKNRKEDRKRKEREQHKKTRL